VTAEVPADGRALEAAEIVATGEPRVNAEVPAGGRALAAAEIAPTGEPRVDAALASLGRLALLPVGEHPAVFEQVHRGLREVLGELDGGSGGGAGSAGRPGR
jgi:hypothetical protein